MADYIPLTKIVKDSDGKEFVACKFFDTKECQNIHNTSGCNGCKMMCAILNQLNQFENILLNQTEKEN